MKYRVAVNKKSFEVELLERKGTSLAFAIEGEQFAVDISPAFELTADNASSPGVIVPQNTKVNKSRPITRSDSGDVIAPMPGVIVSVAAVVGAEVSAGAPLLVMEAMKMENSITAPRAGKISKVLVKPGQQVEGGQTLISIE